MAAISCGGICNFFNSKRKMSPQLQRAHLIDFITHPVIRMLPSFMLLVDCTSLSHISIVTIMSLSKWFLFNLCLTNLS